MDAVLASSLLGLRGSLPLAVLLVCCLLLDGRRCVLLGDPKGQSYVELGTRAAVSTKVVHLQGSALEKPEELEAQVKDLGHLGEDPDSLLEREVHEGLDIFVEEGRGRFDAQLERLSRHPVDSDPLLCPVLALSTFLPWYLTL